VVVTGATGLVGRALCARLAAEGVPFCVLSRNPARARRLVPGALSYQQWETIERGGPWVALLERARAVVHLASPLAAWSRWTSEYTQALYDSCVVGTRGLVSAVAQAGVPPEAFVSASAVGYYAPSPDGAEVDEAAPPGDGYLSRLAADWEAAAAHVEDFGVRAVCLRSGLVLARGGAVVRLRRAARLGFGGPVPPGTQPQPWIHLEDEVGLVLLALRDRRVRGPLNCVAPEAVSSAEFMARLRALAGVPFGLGQPRWLVRGAVAATCGRGAAPRLALEMGYEFRYPRLAPALLAALRGARA
jgi:uncharacterized protein (TIGR01777 family)